MASVDSSSQKRLSDRLAEVTDHIGQNVTIQGFIFTNVKNAGTEITTWFAHTPSHSITHCNSTTLLASRDPTFSFPWRYHSIFHNPFWLLETPPSHSPDDITFSSMVLVWIISFRSNNSIINWDAWSPQPQFPRLQFRIALHSSSLPPALMATGKSSYTLPPQPSQTIPSHQVLLFPEIPLPGTHSRSFVALRTFVTSIKLG